jgi:hypothetical protein
MQIESKKELKKRGFRSTDLGDALVLTFAEELDETPVLTPEMEALGVTENMLMKMYKSDNGTQQDDYDPLSYMDRYSASKGNFV